jgi:hypothetical protein
MAIIDNILALPTYGERYNLTYKNRVDDTIAIKIFERGYTGLVDELIGGGTECTVGKSFLDGDFFRPIAGTQIELTLYAETTNQFQAFRYADNRKYFVTVQARGITMAFGYLLPETFEQDWGSLPDMVRITATCGLGILKEVPFENNDGSTIKGLERLSDIVSYCLYRAGFPQSYVWYDCLNIVPINAATPANGTLWNCYTETDQFEGLNCEEVLSRILESFNAQISQFEEGYMILSPDEPEVAGAIAFGYLGAVLATGLTDTHEYNFGTDGKAAGRGVLKMEAKVKEIGLVYTKIVRDNLLDGEWEIQAPAPPAGDITFREDGTVIVKNTNRFIAPRIRMPIQRQGSLFPRSFLKVTIRAVWDYTWADQTGRPTEANFNYGLTGTPWPPMTGVGASFRMIVIPVSEGRAVTIERVIEVPTSTDDVYFTIQTTADEVIDRKTWTFDNLQIELVKNAEGEPFELKREFDFSITGGESNNRVLIVEKYFHYVLPTTTFPFFDVVERYAYKNQFLLDAGGGFYETFAFWQEIGGALPFLLHNYIREKYQKYYSLTKIRYSGGFWDFGIKTFKPFTAVKDGNIEQLMKVSSYTWQPKQNYYELELIGFALNPDLAEWILETGFWDDLGVWIDTATWND